MDLGNNNRILVISDTHIGSSLENMSYLDMVYNYAKKNNITKILHGGDLFDGIDDKDRICLSYKSQIEHLIRDYPQDSSITNYVLYGNHDYSFIKNGYNLNELLKPRKDIVNIGIKKAYIKINNHMLSITHNIRLYKEKTKPLNISKYDLLLHLQGHSHRYRNDIDQNNTIYIPSLSDKNIIVDKKEDFPGFLEIEFFNSYVIITNIKIEKNVKRCNQLVHTIKGLNKVL